MHFEFIGPPGAGKTTLHARLCDYDWLYGGVTDDAVSRTFRNQANSKRKRLYRTLPAPFRSLVDEKVLEPRLRNDAFNDFVSEHPRCLGAMEELITRVERRPLSFWYFRNAAETYQLGASTASSEERLLIDEGFCHRMALLLWRSEADIQSEFVDRYFEAVPLPAILVFVNAPSDVCLRRQHERDRVPSAEHRLLDESAAQQRLYRSCMRVTDMLSSQIRVRHIETGTGVSMEEATEELYTGIKTDFENICTNGTKQTNK